MKKSAKKVQKVMPKFSPNTMVCGPATLVVDDNGIAWWVDPQSRTITQAQ